ncbi:MAG TPA: hypothetical protein VK699_04910 [Terriglobales bacterium]|jgi:hypothetical protein|nr:hypothetical protein [Terriglobales bacterium]
MKRTIRSKLRRLAVAVLLGLIPAIVTPFVLTAIAPDLQNGLAR